MSSQRVVVYSTSWCPWCTRAKAILEEHGVPFEEIDVEAEWGAGFRDELAQRTGGRTVPQIVIDGKTIGGCEDLMAIAQDGGLAGLRSGGH